MNNENEEVVKLFWTGGWDSTFRLLQALIIEGKKVQPYYIIDPGRKSLEIEKRTMDRIKTALFLRFPHLKEDLLPTMIFDLNCIKQNAMITGSYRRMSSVMTLGPQYDWLARFCEQMDLSSVELCIEKGAGSQIDQILITHFKKDIPELDESIQGEDVYVVFQYFRFPIILKTKLKMKEFAKQNGFLDLMNLTWFCHFPAKNGKPCGECKPCISVIEDGLGYRIPLKRRFILMVKKIVMNSVPLLMRLIQKSRSIEQ